MRRVAIVLGLAAALAAPAAASAEQRLVTITTRSTHVDPARVEFNGPPPGEPAEPPGLRVNILLPDGYDLRKRYPVLYLLHGHGDSYRHWANPQRGAVREIARGFGGIVVMPEGARGWYADWWNGGRRADPGWESYYLDELVPLVERSLRVRRGRRWHAIAGLSMGGEGAAYLASQRPGYWGSVASFSGPLSITRTEYAPFGFNTQGEDYTQVFGGPRSFYAAGHDPTSLVQNLRDTRVYVAVGDGVPDPTDPNQLGNTFGAAAEADLRQHAGDFVAAARSQGVDVTYRPHQGIHDWPYWRHDLADAIRWDFFKEVREQPTRWTYRTVRDHGEAFGLRYGFEAPPHAVATFQRSGSLLSGEGQPGERVTIVTPRHRRLSRTLPFTLRLPRGTP